MSNIQVGRMVDKQVAEWRTRMRQVEEESFQGIRRGPLPMVTVSREIGSYAQGTIRQLVTLLGDRWRVWGKALIDEVAECADVHRSLVEMLDEQEQSEMEEITRTLLGMRSLEVSHYRKHLLQALYGISRGGYGVVIGRGANFVLRDALRVRLRACLDTRIERLCREMNLTRREAETLIDRTDRQRSNFIKQVFNRSIDEQCAYEIILWTDRLAPDAAADLIYQAVKHMWPDTWDGRSKPHAAGPRLSTGP